MRVALVALTAFAVFTVVMFFYLVSPSEPSARQIAFETAPVLDVHIAVVMADVTIEGKCDMGALTWLLTKAPVRTARVEGVQWVHFGVNDVRVHPGWVCHVASRREMRRDADSSEGATRPSYQLEPLNCAPNYEGLRYDADRDGTLDQFASEVFNRERSLSAAKLAEQAGAVGK